MTNVPNSMDGNLRVKLKASQLYAYPVLKFTVRKDMPRLLGMFAFFFMMGGYGPLVSSFSGSQHIDTFNAVVGAIGTLLMTICTYFVIIMGRQLMVRYRLSLSRESST